MSINFVYHRIYMINLMFNKLIFFNLIMAEERKIVNIIKIWL
jgi:hypothetical protein